MASGEKGPLALVGTVVDSLPDWSLRIRTNCLVVIDDQGTIVAIGEASDQAVAEAKEKYIHTYVLSTCIHCKDII
jgi:hypothetical protein